MHRLGVGGGLAALERHQQARHSYASLSSELSQTQLTLLQSQLTQFRTALAHFASTHRDKIAKDASFRHAFQQMCTSISVDPLAGPRRGGWWAELTGIGDWQHELGVQIVDVCVSTRERNGGLIEMGELVRMLGRLRGVGSGEVGEEDVVRSIRTLSPLGAGYTVVEGGGRRMVRSVVKELDDDQMAVIAVAHDGGGCVEVEGLVRERGWVVERARAALENMLLRDGLCWLDEQDESCPQVYWVPSAMHWVGD